MGITVLWLFISHSLPIGIGVSLIMAGYPALGSVFAALIPGLRFALRFRASGSYRLIGDAGAYWGNLADRGGRVTQAEQPQWFKLCVAAEALVLVALYALMLWPR